MTDKPIATEGFTPLKSQVTHARKIADEAQSRLYRKYLKGAEEHAPTVLETDYSLSQLVEFAIDEAIDQLTYLLTLRERMRDGVGETKV